MTQLMPVEKFECLMFESLAHLEESKRVHEMFVAPLLTDAITMRLDIIDSDNPAVDATAIGIALGDSWCMDNMLDKAQAITAIVKLVSGNKAGGAAQDE